MACNHFAEVFELGGPLGAALRAIGFFTAPVMCFFLVEGYHYTHSKAEYGARLLFFALLSQFPFAWSTRYYKTPNILFTLFVCFLIIHCMETMRENVLKYLAIGVLFAITLPMDWGILAPFLVIALTRAKGDRNQQKLAFAAFIVISFGVSMMQYNHSTGFDLETQLGRAIFENITPVIAAVTVLDLYNGKRAAKRRNFYKWFFYIFYPAHLLLLGLLRNMLY